MDSEGQEIRIVGVDKEAIKLSPDKKDCWTVHFKLSGSPDHSWEKKFYETHQRDKNIMKRKAYVEGDCIKIEIAETDDLQKILDAIKIIVLEANVLCGQDHQVRVKIRQELEVLRQRQADATRKLQEDIHKLKF